jgi:hypothetical protein
VYQNVNLLLKNQQAPFGLNSILVDLQRISLPSVKLNLPECQGKIETKTILASKKWIKISGWLGTENGVGNISSVALFGMKDKKIGYGISGFVRADVEKTNNKLGVHTGFEGYILSGQKPTSIVGVSNRNAICIMTA